MEPKPGEAQIALLFLDIAVILAVTRLMGALFRRFRQPAVIGEIIGGIVVAPPRSGNSRSETARR
jgi:Kef-type K+ transport system membrane component KefB